MDWQSLDIEEERAETTSCDCCGKNTVEPVGNVLSGSDFLSWYVLHRSEGHLDIPPVIQLYTGDWSEGAPADTRWGVTMQWHLGPDGGLSLGDWSPDSRQQNSLFTPVDRDDIIGSAFEKELWPMVDAIIMKDTRLKELRNEP